MCHQRMMIPVLLIVMTGCANNSYVVHHSNNPQDRYCQTNRCARCGQIQATSPNPARGSRTKTVTAISAEPFIRPKSTMTPASTAPVAQDATILGGDSVSRDSLKSQTLSTIHAGSSVFNSAKNVDHSTPNPQRATTVQAVPSTVREVSSTTVFSLELTNPYPPSLTSDGE